MATIRMAQSRQETQEFSLENLYSVAVNATHVIFHLVVKELKTVAFYCGCQRNHEK